MLFLVKYPFAWLGNRRSTSQWCGRSYLQVLIKHKMKPIKLAGALALAISSLNSASGAVLVDFSAGVGSAPAGADPNGNFWTTVAVNTLVQNLRDSATGIATTIDIQVAFTTGNPGQASFSSGGNPGDSAAPAPFNQEFARADSIFANGGTTGDFATISFSDLVANTEYEFLVYVGRTAGASASPGLFDVTAGTAVGTGSTSVANRTTGSFNIISSATGTAAFTFRENEATNSTSNAASLAAVRVTQVPEPSSALLIGTGLLAVLAPRRRRTDAA